MLTLEKLGLAKSEQHFAAATIALIAIGVFNEHYSGTHYAVSVAFFTLMPISMFIITCAFLLAHQGRMALFTVCNWGCRGTALDTIVCI